MRQRLIWVAIAALVGAGAATVVRALGVVPLEITSNSMAPTMERDDWVVVRTLDASDRDEIRRSDVVLFRNPFGSSLRAVKRVIAVGGDTVYISRRIVRVNGRTITVAGSRPLFGDKPLPRTERVPVGHVFVLGDNSGASIDSRSFGPIPETELVGRVWTVLNVPVF